jgi:transposase
MDKAFDDNKADEYQKFEKLMKDAKIQMLIKGDEKSIGYSLNIAGGKRNKKSRRKTRRN